MTHYFFLFLIDFQTAFFLTQRNEPNDFYFRIVRINYSVWIEYFRRKASIRATRVVVNHVLSNLLSTFIKYTTTLSLSAGHDG